MTAIEQNLQDEIMRLTELMAKTAEDPAGGITRLLYTKEWLESQRTLKSAMEEIGLRTYFDEVGNLFGRLEAAGPSAETILTGSHVDTVRNGGKYDGMFGIIAGMVALRYLKDQYGPPLRNIEVVSFAEEEGSRFPTVFWGSKNMLGIADQEDVRDIKDHEGRGFVDEMRNCGFDFSKEHGCKEATHFLEVHVEQGNVLELEQKDIAVVNAIVGQRRYNVEVTGVANHAGTTPMQYRKDALHAATRMISQILDRAQDIGDPLVATVGFIEAIPNIVNVIPGGVRFSLDVRHTNAESIRQFTDLAELQMKRIAKQCNVEVSFDLWMDEPPVPMDAKLVSRVERICKKQGLNYKTMHSGAGHDSQLIAQHIPTAMLFVPSRDGISHNPLEYTAPEYLEKGVRALIGTLYELAYTK